MPVFAPGQIVVTDWRDALPREPNKLRPAVVIEDANLLVAEYPNVILVPLSADEKLAIPDLSLAIDPTPENGCQTRCYALSNYVTTASKRRVRPTDSRITCGQLNSIRRQIGTAIGLT